MLIMTGLKIAVLGESTWDHVIEDADDVFEEVVGRETPSDETSGAAPVSGAGDRGTAMLWTGLSAMGEFRTRLGNV